MGEASPKHGGARARLVSGNALLLAQVARTSLPCPALLRVAKEAGRRHQATNPTQTTGREVRRSGGAQVRPHRRRRPRLRDGQVGAQRDGVVTVLPRDGDVERHAAQVRRAGLRNVREWGSFCVYATSQGGWQPQWLCTLRSASSIKASCWSMAALDRVRARAGLRLGLRLRLRHG